MQRVGGKGSNRECRRMDTGNRQLVGQGGAGQIWSGNCLPTLNSVHLADSVADSATEAGQPGCSLLHLGHGVLEPDLKARQDTRLTFQPTSSPELDLL